MADHPYKSQPPYAMWSRAVGRIAASEVDPVVRGKFRISETDKVVTSGSCFAQHISRRLSALGFNFHVTEKPHPYMDEKLSAEFGYGTFSARYGNVYTSRQLLQLLRRALGDFVPAEQAWQRDGKFFDPFRPGIQQEGFASREELALDRAQHLRAVMRAFSEMDVFVFTLGLTECWYSKEDGAAFPTCPGVIAGEFDEARHGFCNLEVDEVASDMLSFIETVRSFNPNFRMILTVSPVPLAATALDQHVLTATTYSKSVLRVAAAKVERTDPDAIAYFPSYEIITGAHAGGRYFADDLRNVVEDGVDHVMRLFFRHYTTRDEGRETSKAPATEATSQVTDLQRLVAAQCEEAMLDVGPDH